MCSPLKPATMWTTSPPTDDNFAMLLLHGIYPMAPAPSGDHSLGLSGISQFLKFGPMLRALHGREWNLTPHAISCSPSAAAQLCSANLFDVPDGSLVAAVVLTGNSTGARVVRAGTHPPPPPPPASGTVDVQLAAPLVQGRKAELLQVGRAAPWVAVATTRAVKVEAGVAMLRFAKP